MTDTETCPSCGTEAELEETKQQHWYHCKVESCNTIRFSKSTLGGDIPDTDADAPMAAEEGVEE